MKAFWRFRHALYLKVSQSFAHATLVEGTLKDNNESVRCLFIDNSELTEYLLHKIYSGQPRILRRWRVLVPFLPRLIKHPPVPLDLCIAVVPLKYEQALHGLYDYRTQEFVRQVIDVLPTWEEVKVRLHRTPRGTGRLIRKYGLSYRISNDQREFDFFYHHMYRPHIEKQYESMAFIDSYEEMKEFFTKGFLLLVEEGNQPIAGSLCLLDENVLTYRRMGLLEGDEAYIKKGGQMAVFYFSLHLAIERKLDKFDLMKSKAFLNDGVYLHKRGWGATVLPDHESESWVYFFNLGPSEKIAKFYKNNPLIAHTKTGLKGVLGIESESIISPEMEKDLIHRFYAPGLEGLILLTSKSKVPIEVSFKNDKRSETLYTQ